LQKETRNDIIKHRKEEVRSMNKRHEITEEQMRELEAARKKNKNKNVEKRLKALILFAGGLKREEIAKQTGFAKSYISEIVGKYDKLGLEAIAGNKYHGNRRNMSVGEEAEFLAAWRGRAAQGEMIEVSEIKNAYCERVGHSIGGQQIYLVLRRHGWRKVMPRSQHPNKASDEAIEASKKLTSWSEKKRTNVWMVASD